MREGVREEGSTEEGKNGRESKHSNSIATEEREIIIIIEGMQER